MRLALASLRTSGCSCIWAMLPPCCCLVWAYPQWSYCALLRITANYCKPGFAVMPAGVVRAHMCAAMVGAIHVEKSVGLALYGAAGAMDGDKGAWLAAHSVGAHADKIVALGTLADGAYADKVVGLLAALVLAYVEKSVWSRPHPLRMQGASRLL